MLDVEFLIQTHIKNVTGGNMIHSHSTPALPPLSNKLEQVTLHGHILWKVPIRSSRLNDELEPVNL